MIVFKFSYLIFGFIFLVAIIILILFLKEKFKSKYRKLQDKYSLLNNLTNDKNQKIDDLKLFILEQKNTIQKLENSKHNISIKLDNKEKEYTVIKKKYDIILIDNETITDRITNFIKINNEQKINLETLEETVNNLESRSEKLLNIISNKDKEIQKITERGKYKVLENIISKLETEVENKTKKINSLETQLDKHKEFLKTMKFVDDFIDQ